MDALERERRDITRSDGITRRELLRELLLAGAATGVAAVSAGSAVGLGYQGLRFLEQFYGQSPAELLREPDWSFLEKAKDPFQRLPTELVGTGLDTPYLWGGREDAIKRTIEDALAVGAKTTTIFLDGFEPELGKYDLRVVEKIRDFCRIVQEVGGGQISVVPVIFNGYQLLSSDKPTWIYPSVPLSSVYLKRDRPKLEAQKSFFTDPELNGYFAKRIEAVMTQFGDIKIIKTWIVANELEVPGVSPSEATAILTNWYKMEIDEIRRHDKERSLITGLAFPWLIDEGIFIGKNVINSVHIYPRLNRNFIDSLVNYLPGSQIPLFCGEVGVPSRYFGFLPVPVDEALVRFVREIYWQAYAATGRLPFGHLSVWKGRDDLHDDKFSFEPDRQPKTVDMLRRLGEVYRKLGW